MRGWGSATRCDAPIYTADFPENDIAAGDEPTKAQYGISKVIALGVAVLHLQRRVVPKIATLAELAQCLQLSACAHASA